MRTWADAGRVRLLPALVTAALTSAVVSSLGMLLVPTIADEMSVSINSAQWILTVNLLVGAVATPIMGRLSDGPHKKRLLLWALSTIAVGSVITAVAPNFAVFLIGRALQGLTYGIVPVTIALARRYLPEKEVRSGISSLSVSVANGLGVGYPLTGVLAHLAGFRFAFWFAAIFTVVALVVVWRVVPDGPDVHAPTPPFDARGASLLAVGLACLLLAISEAAVWGASSAPTILVFFGALSLLSAWVVAELRTAHPLIDLRVLRSADAVVANATAVGLGAAMYIGLSVASLIAQAPTSTGYGIALPLLWAGFVMLPLSVGSFAANRLVRALSSRVPMTTLLLIGSVTVTFASFSVLFFHHTLPEILVGFFGFGVGIGMTYAAMPALIARTVAATELGSAVSFNQVLRTVGGCFGSAVSGAVLAAHLSVEGRPTESGVASALAIGAVACTLVCVALMARRLVVARGR